jgi:hypothetical protein
LLLRLSDKESGPGGGVGLPLRAIIRADGLTDEIDRIEGVIMTLNKLARWASVTAFSAIIPAAALAATHHSRLTSPTTAPSALTTRHVKTTAGKKILASKLKTRTVKSKQLKSVKHKATALKSKKATPAKLVSRKSTVAKLTTKKHVAGKLVTAKTKAHLLASHKAAAKAAVKRATTPAPTM